MKKIASFTIDHTILPKGMYLSRTDMNTVTYDIRCRRPNVEEVMENGAIHTLEHLFATFVRNSDFSDKIIYFGPISRDKSETVFRQRRSVWTAGDTQSGSFRETRHQRLSESRNEAKQNGG